MFKKAIVLPADPAAPHRIVEWKHNAHGNDFLNMAYREIGTPNAIDSSRIINTPLGPIHYWCDDVGLLQPIIDHNDRGIALFRALGYQVPDIAGTIVIVGGITPDEYVDGLNPTLLYWLDERLTEVTAELIALIIAETEKHNGTD